MRTLVFVSLAAIALCSCNKKEQSSAEESADKAAPAAEVEAPPPPFEGELTLERMKAAKDAVKPFMKWADAEPLLLANAGAPKSSEGSKHEWYLADGDTCHILSVEKTATGEVGAVSLGGYDKMMKSQYAKCVPQEPTGEGEAPATDPN